jgi:hypothetical protein
VPFTIPRSRQDLNLINWHLAVSLIRCIVVRVHVRQLRRLMISSHCSLSLALERRFHSTSRSKNSITCAHPQARQRQQRGGGVGELAVIAQDDRNGREIGRNPTAGHR